MLTKFYDAYFRDIRAIAMSRPSIRGDNSKRFRFFAVKPQRFVHVTPAQLSDFKMSCTARERASTAKELESLKFETLRAQHSAEFMQRQLEILQAENSILRKQLISQTSRADSILGAWKSATDMNFALECRYGIGLTVEQFNAISNAMSNEFDEASQRWTSKRIPGVGKTHKNYSYMLQYVLSMFPDRCQVSKYPVYKGRPQGLD